jgi:multidrug resistance efflux pump
MKISATRLFAIALMAAGTFGISMWVWTVDLGKPGASLKKQAPPVDLSRAANPKSTMRTSRINKSEYRVVIHARGKLVFPVVLIRAEVTGRIHSAAEDFVTGARVQSGQPLWLLDDREFLGALAEANAMVHQILAELSLERVSQRSLRQSVSVAQADMDRALAQIDLENAFKRKALSGLGPGQLGYGSNLFEDLRRDLSEANHSYAEAKRVLEKARDRPETTPLVVNLITEDVEAAEARLAAARDKTRELELELRVPQINLATRSMEAARRQLEKAMQDLAELPLARENELGARLVTARLNLIRAREALKRVVITAPPFSGVVSEIVVKDGDRIVPGTLMAKIQTAEHAQAVLSIPRESLDYLKLNLLSGKSGSLIRDTWLLRAVDTGLACQWQVRLDDALEWRNAADHPEAPVQFSLRVDQPYRRAATGINLDGLAVEATVQGGTLRDVFVLPKSAIRNGNEVLLCRSPNQMQWQRVEVVWNDQQHVVTRGTWRGQPVLEEGMFFCLEPQSIGTFLLPDGFAFVEAAD